MKKLHILLLLLLFASASYAQKYTYFGVSMHFVNFQVDQYTPGNWQPTLGPAKLLVGFPITEKLSIMPTGSIGRANYTGLPEDALFWNFDGNLKYDFTLTKLQPYVMAGAGLSHINANQYGGINAGVGLNYWIYDDLALNAQTNWNALPNFHNYFQTNLGLMFRFAKGPKDSDKDGIADDLDSCPNLAGVASANGCPDADGDGVKDADDACPNEKGSAASKGCPDSDGDGVIDSQDKCPQKAGKAEFAGCPDTDGDGIQDSEDACPNEKGTVALKGCPDRDGDGIADAKDACPDVKGTEAMKGCPDRDGDGVADNEDNCPDQPGTVERKGCPEIKADEVKKIEEKLNIAARKIQFETGSAKIKEASLPEIDQVVSIMNQYTFTNFDVEGHTDNVGKAENNKSLSQQRADAVKTYITSKGIANDRLNAIGYGSDKPIAPNTNAAGRAQNRRVEIHLKQ